MIDVFDLHAHLCVPLLLILQVIFHVHVDLVNVVILLQQIVCLGSLRHEVRVLGLQIALLPVEPFELLVHGVQSA
jgi:hypothetical protein